MDYCPMLLTYRCTFHPAGNQTSEPNQTWRPQQQAGLTKGLLVQAGRAAQQASSLAPPEKHGMSPSLTSGAAGPAPAWPR